MSDRTALLWQQQPGAFRAWLALGVYNILLGAVLVAGGAARVSGSSFTLIRSSGGHILWGSGLITLGVIILVAALVSIRIAGFALLLGAIAHGWIAAQFVGVAASVPDAALTGCVTYALCAFWHASVASVYSSGPTT